jgi:hypothetical protein
VTQSLIVEWRPDTPDAELRELELWSAAVTDGVQVVAGSPEAGRVFSVPLGVEPAALSRAYLSYELQGLPHWSTAVRSYVSPERSAGNSRAAAEEARVRLPPERSRHIILKVNTLSRQCEIS